MTSGPRPGVTTHNMCYTGEYRKFAVLLYKCRHTDLPIADGWDDFRTFWEELGPCPANHTALMKDKTKGLSPGNIIWVRRKRKRKLVAPIKTILRRREAFPLKL